MNRLTSIEVQRIAEVKKCHFWWGDPASFYIQGRNQAGLQQQNLEVWMLAEAKRAAWNVMIECGGCAVYHLRTKQQ